jgi:hypothetical protein
MSWDNEAGRLVKVGLELGVGFGLMGYILYTFLTALGATTTGGSFVNSILNAFSTSITTVLPAMITIAFILVLYLMVKGAGLIGNNTTNK